MPLYLIANSRLAPRAAFPVVAKVITRDCEQWAEKQVSSGCISASSRAEAASGLPHLRQRPAAGPIAWKKRLRRQAGSSSPRLPPAQLLAAAAAAADSGGGWPPEQFRPASSSQRIKLKASSTVKQPKKSLRKLLIRTVRWRKAKQVFCFVELQQQIESLSFPSLNFLFDAVGAKI